MTNFAARMRSEQINGSIAIAEGIEHDAPQLVNSPLPHRIHETTSIIPRSRRGEEIYIPLAIFSRSPIKKSYGDYGPIAVIQIALPRPPPRRRLLARQIGP